MSGTSGSYVPQSSTGYKPMTVPEKIQLSTGGENTGLKADKYKPMKVPDRITLDDPSPASSSVVAPPIAEGLQSERDHVSYSQEPTAGRRHLEPITNRQRVPNFQRDSEIPANPYPEDISQRLHILEERVETLENRVGQISGNSSSGPSRFWYVVTFSSWMMVPLAVVFMFYYRRNS